MQDKDKILKELFSYNDIACQFINLAVFNGENVVKPEDLTNLPTVNSAVDSKGKRRESIRDIFKGYSKDGIKKGYFGIENQTSYDNKMMSRIIKYDINDYFEIENNGDNNEIITIVFYYGTRRQWPKPFNFLDKKNHMTKDVIGKTDCHLLVINMAYLRDEDIEKLSGDSKVMALLFRSLRLNEVFEELPEDIELSHPEEIMELFEIYTDSEIYSEILTEEEKEKKEPITMNTATKRMIDRLHEEGRAEGRAEGRKEIVLKLQKRMSTSEIAIIVGETEETVNNWLDSAAAI